ncbi:GumC family protein [Geomonas ferrireducens]|uniref:GumC family protein n=1 Tax=Geomonas ferrireducens TaxID=2570227 RepID=UPI001FE8CB4F|nr:Wzz/FepE/Etk N-terminal domain-containing protein [Geomonas ferrireducens]
MNTDKPDVDITDEINLLKLLIVLAKHWKMIVVVPLIVVVITAIATLFIPNMYTAKAMILPVEDNSGGMMSAMMAQMGGLAALAGGGLGGTTKTDQYVTMMNSEVIQDPIIDRFKLMDLYKAKFRAKAYSALRASTDIRAGKKDGIITIAVSNERPKLAADIANAYVEELGKLTAKLAMTGAGANRLFLEERLAKARSDLTVAEDALKTFQTRNKAVAIPDQAKATLEGVAVLRAQLAAQEVQLGTMRQQLTNESQEVKAAKATIANLRRQISQLEGSKSEGSLPGVGAMPQLGQEYIRLMREFKVQETLVELLTKQYEMTKLNEAKDVAPFQLLQSAKVPEVKSKPRRGLIVIVAACMTGLFMVIFAFLLECKGQLSHEDRKLLDELKKYLPSPLKKIV